MRSLFPAISAMALLAGAASAQPIVPETGAGSVRPAPTRSTLNVPAFISNPSSLGPAPAFAPSPTTPIPQGQFAPAPAFASPQIGLQPAQIPPSILEHSKAMTGGH